MSEPPPNDLLTEEDHEALLRYNGSNEDLFATVERIVRHHRAKALAEVLAEVLDLSEEIITIHGYRHDVIQSSAIRRFAAQIEGDRP